MSRRADLQFAIQKALHRSRGVVLSGPLQSGRSTLAQRFLSRQSPNYFDLEYPPHALRLEQPVQTLEALSGLVVIDEVQLKPDLFPLLRLLMDRTNTLGQFLLVGSASPTLLSRDGASLLGRVETIDVGGFDLSEVNAKQGKGAKAATAREIPPVCGCVEGSRVLTWPQPMKTAQSGAAMQ